MDLDVRFLVILISSWFLGGQMIASAVLALNPRIAKGRVVMATRLQMLMGLGVACMGFIYYDGPPRVFLTVLGLLAIVSADGFRIMHSKTKFYHTIEILDLIRRYEVARREKAREEGKAHMGKIFVRRDVYDVMRGRSKEKVAGRARDGMSGKVRVNIKGMKDSKVGRNRGKTYLPSGDSPS